MKMPGFERDSLPDAPSEDIRTGMAVAFIESADYDGGEYCRAILTNIKAGLVIFEPPGEVRMTKQGLDWLNEVTK